MKRLIEFGMTCLPIGSSFVSPGQISQFHCSPQRTMRGPYLLAIAFDGGPGAVQVRNIMLGQETLLCGLGPIDARSLMRSVLLPSGESEWSPIPLDGPALQCGMRVVVELLNQTCATLQITTTLFGYSIEAVERAFRARAEELGALDTAAGIRRHGGGEAWDPSPQLAALRATLEAERKHVRRLEVGAIALNQTAEDLRAELEAERARREAAERSEAQAVAAASLVTDPAFLARARDAFETLDKQRPGDAYEPGDVWETPSDES